MTDKRSITKIKKLLGLSSARQVAAVFKLSVATANNINSGRASVNLMNAYDSIAQLLSLIPLEKKRQLTSLPKKEITFEQKLIRCKKIKTELNELPSDIQEALDTAQERLTKYLVLVDEYKSLQK